MAKPEPYIYFAENSEGYARYRPSYPDALFAYLASLCPLRERVWDCGTGSGQAASGFVPHFKQVIATDRSPAQLARATNPGEIHYVAARAEEPPLRSNSVDLVAVAQAAHWFDLDPFYRRSGELLRAGGVLAIWGYDILRISPELDALIDELYHAKLGSYWPARRRHVERHYRTLSFPLDEIESPEFAIQSRGDLAWFIGYLGTWSSARAYLKETAGDAVQEFTDRFAQAWGEPNEEKAIHWPIFLRVGR